ncbi:hypothetical protein WA026_019196 [Henosepilachna vigintioctopunctata]|uniref:Uncharacterized protein n=1 Tax=Henosepilachna vigintioctopunctata TaxID=420089 RepID=A0AAW1UUX3_9CUCU
MENLQKRIIREAIEIEKHKNMNNRDGGSLSPGCCKAIVQKHAQQIPDKQTNHRRETNKYIRLSTHKMETFEGSINDITEYRQNISSEKEKCIPLSKF